MDANIEKNATKWKSFFGGHPVQQNHIELLGFVTYMLRSFLGWVIEVVISTRLQECIKT